MSYFLRVVGFCHILVFSRLLGEVTAGVGLEVNHALSLQRPVYELTCDEVNRITDPITPLTRNKTVELFARWRAKVKEENIFRTGTV